MKDFMMFVAALITVFVFAGAIAMGLNALIDHRDANRIKETDKRCSQAASLAETKEWKRVGTKGCVVLKDGKIVEVE